MKNRILCVILAAIIGVFTFSTSAFAVAPPVSIPEFIINHFIPFIKSVKENDEARCLEKTVNSLTPEGARARAYVLSQFKPFKDYLPSDLSKEDFLQLLLWFQGGDWSMVSETYGSDLGSYVCEHQGDFLDFMVFSIIPVFNGLEDFVNALYDTDLSNYGLDDDGNPQIPVEDFKQELEKQNQTLTPKNRKMYKYSWRELSNEQRDYSFEYLGRTVGRDEKFFDGKSFKDGIYVQPYVIFGDVTYTGLNNTKTSATGSYYTPYQYHIYREETLGDDFVDAETGAHYSNVTYTWYSQALYYIIDNGERLDTFTTKLSSYSSSYTNGVYNPAHYGEVSIGLSSGKLKLSIYGSVSNSTLNPTQFKFWSVSPSSKSEDFIDSEYYKFYKSDNTGVNYNFGSVSKYFNCGDFKYYSDNDESLSFTLEQFEKKVPDDDISDYGLLFSSEPFTTTYLFDSSRFPANSTITLSGDSVYDYSITDNSTGDTSTIYNYVNNNYTYPDNVGGSQGGGSQGGGNGGGNVGGNITVGGQVDVDVNVNGGTGVNASMPNLDAVQGYLDEANSESSDFKLFLKDFFSFLPNDILLLLLIALSVCIVCRIVGR